MSTSQQSLLGKRPTDTRPTTTNNSPSAAVPTRVNTPVRGNSAPAVLTPSNSQSSTPAAAHQDNPYLAHIPSPPSTATAPAINVPSAPPHQAPTAVHPANVPQNAPPPSVLDDPVIQASLDRMRNSQPVLPQTNPATADPLARIIHDFLKTKDDGTIQRVSALKGGWEVWLQVELTLYLLSRQDVQQLYTLQRERACFQPPPKIGNAVPDNGICDLWLQPKVADKPAYCVELKVGYHYFNSDAAADDQTVAVPVRPRFMKDVAKADRPFLPNIVNQIAACGVKVLCMAVTCLHQDHVDPEWTNARAAHPGIGFMWLNTDPNVSIKPALIWYVKDIAPAQHALPVQAAKKQAVDVQPTGGVKQPELAKLS